VSTKTYLKEIQYLRFLAVFFVILFHLNPFLFVGGFIGVDIFFVISGYLITKSLITNSSIQQFLIRRLKRIFPSLFLIQFLICFIVIIFFLEDDFKYFFKSYIWSIAFLSNFYYWLDFRDYFSIPKSQLPLLHTWSISLEMQFYLVFAVLFKFILRPKYSVAILILIFSLSLILSINFISREQSFYLIPFRIHEFLIGSFINFIPKKKFNNYICDFLFIVSNGILLFLLFNFTNTNFPGLKALYVCIFPFIIIYFNNYKIIAYLISNRILMYFGKISYTLFLVHWPILVIYNYRIVRKTSLGEEILLLLTTIVLSSIIYKYYEDIFINKKNKFFLKSLPIFFILGFIQIFLLNYVIKRDFFTEIRSLYLKNGNLIKELSLQNPRLNGYSAKYKQEDIKTNNKKNILIFGDSHAEEIYFSLKNIEKQYNFYYFGNNLNCSSILKRGDSIFWFEIFTKLLFNKEPTGKVLYEECFTSYTELNAITQKIKFEEVFISMRWSNDELKHIDYIINFFLKEKYQKVFLISKRIEILDPKRSLVSMSPDTIAINNYFSKNKIVFNDINQKLADIAIDKKILFIDINKYILTDNNFIFYDEAKNLLNYIDESHFSEKKLEEISRVLYNKYINNY
jgi:peptidoglycan/LPS O-acetylase OafA/YrhL